MRVHVRAPASTANLGPGFDCAAAALELWNELIVEPNGAGVCVEIEGESENELSRDEDHLALRAFARFASPAGYRFRFINRIPLERGLGASASTIALGLIAGATVAGALPTTAELLTAGEPFEGHSDNLAATLYGGVCISWRRNGVVTARQLADDLPLAPVLVVPIARTRTFESRSGLPFTVKHEAAAESAAAAALLGAAIAGGDAELLANSFHDRLHEPYRLTSAPLLAKLRERLPDGAVGVTLSGSGPSVVVWALEANVEHVVGELRRSLSPETTVLPLRVAQTGASLE
jgi:homoserine kinase